MKKEDHFEALENPEKVVKWVSIRAFLIDSKKPDRTSRVSGFFCVTIVFWVTFCWLWSVRRLAACIVFSFFMYYKLTQHLMFKG